MPDSDAAGPTCEVLGCLRASIGRVFLSTPEGRATLLAAGSGIGFVWLCDEHAPLAKEDADGLLQLLGLAEPEP